MRIFHLAYYSTAIGTPDSRMLREILVVARRENDKRQITGFLARLDNHFFQLLEGSEDAVRETLSRIKKDPRHSNVTVVAEFYSGERMAPQWSMCHVEPSSPTSSADNIIRLLDSTRGGNLIEDKASIEVFIRRFAKSAVEVKSESNEKST